jgi:hypothetical protein
LQVNENKRESRNTTKNNQETNATTGKGSRMIDEDLKLIGSIDEIENCLDERKGNITSML